MLLLLRFCVYFSLQTLKIMIIIWPHLNFFSYIIWPHLLGCVGLATALTDKHFKISSKLKIDMVSKVLDLAVSTLQYNIVFAV